MKFRLAGVLSAAALAVGLSAVGFTQVASAGLEPIGAAPLTIVKTVSGPVPAGTTFTATIECDDTIIDTGEDPTDEATVTFDASGQPTSADTFTFNDPGQCTVTETATGGAATTTYACAGTVPVDSEGVGGAAIVEPDEPICPAAGPQVGPITVNIVFEEQTATATIANTFVAAPLQPQVAPQIVAQPAFTG
jgi:hypothetical protein